MKQSDKDAVAKLVPLLRSFTDACLGEAGGIKFDKQYPPHLLVRCLYGTLLEHARSLSVLAEQQQMSALPVVLRSLLEAYASLRCCLKDPQHAKIMVASFVKQKLTLVESALAHPENPYVKEIAKSASETGEKAVIEQELAELQQQSYSPLKIWKEFAKAGLTSEYQSLYWQLCMYAHNNVSALEDRHLGKKDGDYEVVFFKEEDPADVIRYVDSTCGILLDASLSVHSFLETGLVKNFDSWAGKLAEIRSAYA